MTASLFKILAAFGIGFAAGAWLCGRVETRGAELRVLTRCDTVRVTAPVRTEVRYIKSDTVRMPAAESSDSVRVVVPREQAEYIGETYRAYVSGFEPRLDSIVMLRSIVTPVPRRTPPRFSVGLQAGYGVTPRGFQPYIGIGVSYSIKF